MKSDSPPERRPDHLTLGQRIRDVRKALGLRLSDLSRLTDISISQLSKIETGRIDPRIPALVKIGNALGRPLTFFFQTEAEIPRSLATLMPLVGPEGDAVTAFAAAVQERSSGRVRLEVLPSAELDRFSDVPGTLLSGAIDMLIEGLAFYQSHAEALVPASLPFCLRGWDHYEAFLRSEFFHERIVGTLLDKGVRFLDRQWRWRRAPQVLVSRKPIFGVEDLLGTKIRIYDSDYARQFWEVFGATPVFVPWLETRQALAEGTVDCVAVSAGLLATTGFAEVASYATFVDLLDAMVTTVNVGINEERYRLLPPDIQRVLSEAATEIAQGVTATLSRQSEDGLARCIAEHDLVTIRVNLRPFRERAWAVLRDLERSGRWEAGLLESIRNV